MALGFLLLFATTSTFAALRAELDRDSVQEGGTLTLTLEADGAHASGQPDLSPLQKDFRVLGTSTSNQVSIINGRSSSRVRWLVQLQPRHLGKLVVPAVLLGTERSAPLALEVTDAPQQAEVRTGQHVFLEAELPKGSNAYRVAQQIPYTLRLYYDDALRDGGLDSPQTDNAIIEQVGKEHNYDTVRNGHRLHVIERHYAITPEKSGQLHIPPATFRGQVAGAQPTGGGSNSFGGLMEDFLRQSPFANDPMFKNGFANLTAFADQGQPVTVQSRAVTLDIQPRPAAASGTQWLPAEQVTLSDSWSEHPPEFKVGEPVTRTITIEAAGLSGTQIPEIAFAQPANARLYREASSNESRSDGESIHGVSKQNITYIPAARGTLSIPAVELGWWNTRSNSQSRATLPQREFNVEPGAAGSAEANAAPAPAGAPGTGAGAPAAAKSATPDGLSTAERVAARWPYPAAGGVLLIALLATLVLGRRGTRGRSGATVADAKSLQLLTTRSSLRALREGCEANDARAAAKALLALGRAQWPENPPHSLGALAARLARGGGEVKGLDRSLYAPDASDWTGAALWKAFSDGVQEKLRVDRRLGDGIDPLYQ